MPKDRDASIGTGLLNHPGQKGEMIVLHQQERMLRVLQFIEYGSGELLVRLLIGLPIRSAKSGASMGYMA